MSYFSQAEHASLCNDPNYIVTLYARHRARFVADLGPGFSVEIEQHLKFGFCGLVAFDLKPYGVSQAITMADLLSASALDCDNYAILMWRLFMILEPNATTNVAAVGWNGGPIGNHAQMHCHLGADANGAGGGYWMVDPTVGVMLCGYDFDGIARGKPVNPIYIRSFHKLCGRDASETRSFHDVVVSALLSGSYRPSHLLYYYVDIERYTAPVPDYDDWMTPQASALTP